MARAILVAAALASGAATAAAANPGTKGAAAFPARAEIAECRQGACFWRKTIGVRTVKTTSDGELKIERTYVGESDHRDGSAPTRFAPGIAIQWEAAPVETYVFCSRKQPAIAFKDRWGGGAGGWYAHLLDPFETYGYNRGSAATYMRVCHGAKRGAELGGRLLRRLGYRPGTRNEQVDLKSPLDLPHPPPPEPPKR